MRTPWEIYPKLDARAVRPGTGSEFLGTPRNLSEVWARILAEEGLARQMAEAARASLMAQAGAQTSLQRRGVSRETSRRGAPAAARSAPAGAPARNPMVELMGVRDLTGNFDAAMLDEYRRILNSMEPSGFDQFAKMALPLGMAFLGGFNPGLLGVEGWAGGALAGLSGGNALSMFLDM